MLNEAAKESGGMSEVSGANMEFAAQQRDRAIAAGVQTAFENAPVSAQLAALAARRPQYARNRTKICTFWLKGECNRGAQCPFRHETPNEDPNMAKQDIKNRFFGVNDPVANKILARADSKGQGPLTPPEDGSITTLFVSGVTADMTREDISSAFSSFGPILRARVSEQNKCAWITMQTRAGAEAAAKALHRNLLVKGISLRLAWGKKSSPHAGVGHHQGGGRGRGRGRGGPMRASGRGRGAPPPPPPGAPPGAGGGVYYPSMDAGRLGATLEQHNK